MSFECLGRRVQAKMQDCYRNKSVFEDISRDMRHHFKRSWLQCLSSPLFSPPYETNVLMTFQNIVQRKTLDNFIHICIHCILCCFT